MHHNSPRCTEACLVLTYAPLGSLDLLLAVLLAVKKKTNWSILNWIDSVSTTFQFFFLPISNYAKILKPLRLHFICVLGLFCFNYKMLCGLWSWDAPQFCQRNKSLWWFVKWSSQDFFSCLTAPLAGSNPTCHSVVSYFGLTGLCLEYQLYNWWYTIILFKRILMSKNN